ncbi:MAG TPA: STN domain-containing protein [Pirellulales bacterium]|nr:STN domain-containing protein [Pirellulales bacterium]
MKPRLAVEFAMVLLAASFVAFSDGIIRGEEPVAWLTGEKLKAQLEQKIGIDWGGPKGNKFRDAIASLSRAQRVAILIDRRVDPDQKIELSIDDATLESSLKLIAANKHIGMAQVGSVIYLGPKATAEKLRTLAALRKDEAIKLSQAVRSRILQIHPMKWEELATPRDLLTSLTADTKVRIDGVDRIPHDLWAAADLPPANFIDRLTLIAGQFDLTFRFADEGESVQLVEMPATPVVEKSYPLRGGLAARAKEIEMKLAESLPGATVEAATDKLIVRGRAEDQDFVETYLSGRPAKRTVTAGEKKVYTLTIVMPVGQLIKTLGKKLDLDVQIDEEAIKAAGLSLGTDVKVNVKDATADELLKAVLAPAGLAFERQGKTIRIRPAK